MAMEIPLSVFPKRHHSTPCILTIQIKANYNKNHIPFLRFFTLKKRYKTYN